MYYPYRNKKKLLSPSEIEFFNELTVHAKEKNLLVFTKVRLADLVFVPQTYKYFNFFFSKIKAKHIDFVLCDAKTFEIKCLIELDDKSHDLPINTSRDKFKNKVIKAAEITFIRCSSPKHVCELI